MPLVHMPLQQKLRHARPCSRLGRDVRVSAVSPTNSVPARVAVPTGSSSPSTSGASLDAAVTEILEAVRSLNKNTRKLSKQVLRLETRIGELYEFTSLPIIANHFGTDFSESVELTSATALVDHFIATALNLELPPLQQRSHLIGLLEEYVMHERQGLRAALKALIDEACEDAGVCMVALPSNFKEAPWEDVRACLQELQLGFTSPSGAGDERITNLLRLVDAVSSGLPPPRPLPGFLEMASALASGRCSGHVALDCRGRIDIRETYIEFHVGSFKGSNSGMAEACAHLRQVAALLSWTYRVLELALHTSNPANSPRDVQTIGYIFTVGKIAPEEAPLLKLFDEFVVDVRGARTQADVAYRYFSVRPTGIHEHYAKQ